LIAIVKVILDSVQRLQFNDFRISMRGFKMRGNIQLFISFQITMGTVCGSASPCRITAPFFCWSVVSSRCFVWLLILMLVRCFVPLFCLVAYFDVGPLFRPAVLFGCLF
jgi:hypothetical protein